MEIKAGKINAEGHISSTTKALVSPFWLPETSQKVNKLNLLRLVPGGQMGRFWHQASTCVSEGCLQSANAQEDQHLNPEGRRHAILKHDPMQENCLSTQEKSSEEQEYNAQTEPIQQGVMPS